MIKIIIMRMLILLIALVTAPAMADWPISLTDDVLMHQSEPRKRIYVLANDIGSGLRVEEVNSWSKKGGRVDFSSANNSTRTSFVTYTPANGFVGKDTFWYVMKDDQGRKNAAKVTVTVKPASSRLPDPQNDVVSVEKDKTIRIDVKKNDLFKDNLDRSRTGEITQFNAWSQKGGQITKIDDQLSYTPSAGFVGTDTFWYAVKGVVNDIEHAAMVTVNVTQNNSAGSYPQTEPDSVWVGNSCSGRFCRVELFITPTSNDTGSNLKIIPSSAYSLRGGLVTVVKEESARPKIKYEPKFNYTGEDKIWYTIEDEVGRQNWGTITVDVR